VRDERRFSLLAGIQHVDVLAVAQGFDYFPIGLAAKITCRIGRQRSSRSKEAHVPIVALAVGWKCDRGTSHLSVRFHRFVTRRFVMCRYPAVMGPPAKEEMTRKILSLALMTLVVTTTPAFSQVRPNRGTIPQGEVPVKKLTNPIRSDGCSQEKTPIPFVPFTLADVRTMFNNPSLTMASHLNQSMDPNPSSGSGNTLHGETVTQFLADLNAMEQYQNAHGYSLRVTGQENGSLYECWNLPQAPDLATLNAQETAFNNSILGPGSIPTRVTGSHETHPPLGLIFPGRGKPGSPTGIDQFLHTNSFGYRVPGIIFNPRNGTLDPPKKRSGELDSPLADEDSEGGFEPAPTPPLSSATWSKQWVSPTIGLSSFASISAVANESLFANTDHATFAGDMSVNGVLLTVPRFLGSLSGSITGSLPNSSTPGTCNLKYVDRFNNTHWIIPQNTSTPGYVSGQSTVFQFSAGVAVPFYIGPVVLTASLYDTTSAKYAYQALGGYGLQVPNSPYVELAASAMFTPNLRSDLTGSVSASLLVFNAGVDATINILDATIQFVGIGELYFDNSNRPYLGIDADAKVSFSMFSGGVDAWIEYPTFHLFSSPHLRWVRDTFNIWNWSPQLSSGYVASYRYAIPL